MVPQYDSMPGQLGAFAAKDFKRGDTVLVPEQLWQKGEKAEDDLTGL